jgi:hypothetical protein
MIKIPDDATVVRDQRLDLIRAISTLHDRLIEPKDGPGLKSRVKETMKDKGAKFAQSDFVIAALRGGGTTRSYVDPRKLYKLVADGKLTTQQFLSVLSVRKEPLTEFLSGAEIDRLSSEGAPSETSLFTEFKPGVSFDVDQIAEALQALIAEKLAAVATS